jgi:hypothetical protein
MVSVRSVQNTPVGPGKPRDGPNQLWVAEITYLALRPALAYLAAILEAWSRRVVGSAISGQQSPP